MCVVREMWIYKNWKGLEELNLIEVYIVDILGVNIDIDLILLYDENYMMNNIYQIIGNAYKLL